MDPVTLALVSAGAGALGTGVSAYGQYQSGKAAQDASRQQEAALLAQKKQQEEVTGKNVDRKREANQYELSKVKARLAGSGVDIGSGSAFAVTQKTATTLEQDALDIYSQGMMRAQQIGNQAAIARYEGDVAKYQGTMGAVGTVLTGAASMASGVAGGFDTGTFKVK